MRRREFTLSLGAASLAGVGPARPQQPRRLPVVAYATGSVPLADMIGDQPARPSSRAFVDELRQLGWIEGRTVQYERRSAEGRPELAEPIFAELLTRPVDVICPGGDRWMQLAARKATSAIPIVAHFTEDPVGAGLVASLARPGGNLTGVTQSGGPEIYAKQIELLKHAVPGIRRPAFLASSANVELFRKGILPAGVSPIPMVVDRVEHLDAAFAAILREGADAIALANAPVLFTHFRRVVAFANERKLPAIHAYREIVETGGLMSYGASITAVWRQMARIVDRFLRGARIGDIPVEQPTRYELVVNLKTAKELGIAFPQTIAAGADEVIE